MDSKLKYIYKANQCCDINDVNSAIEQLKLLANGNYTSSMRKRLASLEAKRKKLVLL